MIFFFEHDFDSQKTQLQLIRLRSSTLIHLSFSACQKLLKEFIQGHSNAFTSHVSETISYVVSTRPEHPKTI